ncbi:MAG: hypothetical protein AAF141_08945 [Pseudomonadota bacterium]
MYQTPPLIKSRTKRLIVRGAERRCGQMAFKGRERRRANYDRRKLAEPNGKKPPMSDAGYQPRHSSAPPQHAPAYVADVAAQMGAYRRASSLEASGRYMAVDKGRTDRLLRGLAVDAEIS